VGLAPGQPRYKIMIVEDQRENQLLLSRLMTNLGLEIKIACNGEQCLEIAHDWKPDLIWMDRRMPLMDGLEATRRLRSLPEGKSVKIVAVTASAFKEEQQEMFDAGIDDFLRKPYRFDEVYDCLARQLGIEYIYQDSVEGADAMSAKLTPAMLSGLLVELRVRLKDALESLDGDRIAALIRQIAVRDAVLGLALSALAECFDYPSILAALDALDKESAGD